MVARDVKQRTYDNSRRAEQARMTRRRILDAARDLLLAHGYAGTTIAQVAAAAQVSPETVQKGFGTKAALAKAVYDVTLVGDDEPVPLRGRPEFAALDAEPDPARKLERYAAVGRALWERLGPLLDVLMQGAQAGEPDLVAFVATIRRESHAGASGVVDQLAAAGALRPDLTLDRARDELWLLIQPEMYRLLVGERGWSLDDVQAWFARTASAALLSASFSQPPPRRPR
jgi:AcrR family transcriptional regulator